MPDVTRLEDHADRPVEWPDGSVDWSKYAWNWQKAGLQKLLASAETVFVAAIVSNLAGVPVLAQRRHQVTGIGPAPPPSVIGHVAQAKQCPCCGRVTEGELPAHVRARASYGPQTCAQAANLTCGHDIPVHRATQLLCQLAGIGVSTGWMAGVRARAAALVEAGGFMDRVRELLRAAPAIYAGETPARAAGVARLCTWPAPPT